MNKYLFYAMRGQMMCFLHVLMNAVDLNAAGHEVRIVFEGESVTLPPQLAGQGNKLYLKALESGLIAGVCRACSAQLGVLEENEKLGLPLLSDMNGHAGMRPFAEEGFTIISM